MTSHIFLASSASQRIFGEAKAIQNNEWRQRTRNHVIYSFILKYYTREKMSVQEFFIILKIFEIKT